MTTNWDKALTYRTNLLHIEQKFGPERLQQLMSALLTGGGTFAVSQGDLYTSEFSTHIVMQHITDWDRGEDPKHFEIRTLNSGDLALTEAFLTHEAATNALTNDPLISANENHPFFWGKFFEIVLCGADGCTLRTKIKEL